MTSLKWIKRLIFAMVTVALAVRPMSLWESVSTMQPHVEPFLLGAPQELHTRNNNTKLQDNNFVVDVMVTGSVSRPHYATTQKRTWGSHVSVRHFWIVDERNDDFFPECMNQTAQYAYDVSNKCKQKQSTSDIGSNFRNSFARIQWLQKKSNPTGWICAQTRMPYNMAKIVSSLETLPDYLIIIDDDSYVNLEWFQQEMKSKDSSTPTVYAGCLIRSPIHQINWTLPFGGWGTFYSKGALERLLQPLHCNATSSNATLGGNETDVEHYESSACHRLKDNLVGEESLWRPGMSVLELMKELVTQTPNCLHSDWALSYFVNYYFVSRHTDDNDFYDDVVQSRLHMLEESELYGTKRRTGNCKNYGSLFNQQSWMLPCNANSHVCHYVTPEEMINVSDAVQALHPDKFRNKAYSTSARRLSTMLPINLQDA